MIYYKDNRFYIGGVSYSLPKDICIITKTKYNNGFTYKNPDQTITVMIYTENQYKFPLKNIKFQANEDCFYLTNNIEIGGFGGIEGATFIYEYNNCVYSKIILLLPLPTKTEKLLTIKIKISKGGISIKEAVRDPIVTDLLISLKKELATPNFIYE